MNLIINPQFESLCPPLAANLSEGEARQIGKAFIEADAGRTLANNLMKQDIGASRCGLSSMEQFATAAGVSLVSNF
jgi:hypothetical protein